MPTPPWTEDHSHLVARTAPPVPETTDAEVDRVWNRVAPELAAAPPRRRRGRRIAVGAGVAAVVLGLSGVAAADLFSARTGEVQTDPESIRLGGPGEKIDPRGSDYEQVLREEIADIPFASDEAREIAVADQLFFARRDVRSMEIAQARGDRDWRIVHITGGMRAEAARAALCSWANAWAAATTSGDATGRAEAIAMLEASREWPAITDVDAEQTIGRAESEVVELENGERRTVTFYDNTPFGFLPRIVEAAHGTDLRAMGRPFVEFTRCVPALVPDLPQAVPATFRGQ
ncbi:hypothetical protein [Nocardioides caricicola]|uniref:Uncharacterized protein n=1 Tax=Nocardioides caricicola TaxID=634770 RepID=A0ABW0N0S1_9ACTN